ncbi:MAG: hypothetical protein AB3N20_10525 [Rhizobiaceae bacterium]
MYNLISSIFATATTAFLVLALFGPPVFGPGVDRETTTGSVRSQQSGFVASGGHELFMNGEVLCEVQRGARIAPTVYRLEASPQCIPALGVLDQALYWTENGTGSIVFSNREGTIIEFAETDGAQLESVLPSRPLYNLRRIVE